MIKKIALSVIAVCAVIAFISCSKGGGNSISPTPTEEKSVPYTISLNLLGDFNVTHTPFSKASGSDVYGINIFSNVNDGKTFNFVVGYGLFDDKDKMIVTLLSQYKYKFACDLVIDGKNKLKVSNIGAYGEPFGTTSSPLILENKFVLGSTNLNALGGAKMLLKGADTSIAYAEGVDRYYGELSDFSPSASATATINLKRCVFGAKFIVTGMKGGTLKMSLGKFWSKEITADAATDTLIFACPSVAENWSEDITVAVKYNRPETSTSYWNELNTSQTVNFKRNVLTTLSLNVADLTPDGYKFGITEEPMGSNNDINIDINSGGTIEININPTKP